MHDLSFMHTIFFQLFTKQVVHNLCEKPLSHARMPYTGLVSFLNRYSLFGCTGFVEITPADL